MASLRSISACDPRIEERSVGVPLSFSIPPLRSDHPFLLQKLSDSRFLVEFAQVPGIL